uniref:Macaca fascicularis brain cDNA clone: QflA-18083, similar to human KIAA0368 (KIAA0368), mRNA, RefSeq: XM_036708.12 n=1 Tax=Macaca fascicularis TaxID=9541 RepID=I7GI92_MACFA|nr:unnamed protein product [Macaca fascicularis]
MKFLERQWHFKGELLAKRQMVRAFLPTRNFVLWQVILASQIWCINL